MASFTSELSIKVYNDDTGACTYIGPDRDAQDMVELTTSDPLGKNLFSVLFTKEQAVIIFGSSEPFHRIHNLDNGQMFLMTMNEVGSGVVSMVFDDNGHVSGHEFEVVEFMHIRDAVVRLYS